MPCDFLRTDPRRPESHLPESRREPWRGRSDDTLGVPIGFSALLARNDEAAVLVTAVVAYPSGFGLSLITVSRLSPPTVDPWGHMETPSSAGVLRFGIGVADGSRATDVTLEPHRLVEHDGCVLMPIGDSSGGRKHSLHYWIGASRCRRRG